MMFFGQFRTILIVWFTATLYAGYQPVIAFASSSVKSTPDGGVKQTRNVVHQVGATTTTNNSGGGGDGYYNDTEQQIRTETVNEKETAKVAEAASKEDIARAASASYFPMPIQAAQGMQTRKNDFGINSNLMNNNSPVNTVQQQETAIPQTTTATTTTTNTNSIVSSASSKVATTTTTPQLKSEISKNDDDQEMIQRLKHLFTLMLMAITGIQEAICFRRFGSMPTMMTGNTIRGITALSDMDWILASRSASAVVCYILGGALFKSLSIFLTTKDEQQQKKNNDAATSTTPSKVRHLPLVSRVAMSLFVVADIMHYLTNSKCMLLPAMSIAYGMINMAALHETGAVTNAITGHYSTTGLGFAEHVLFRSQYSHMISNKTPKDKFITSRNCAGVFILSLLFTSIIHKWVISQPQQPWFLSICPPFATTFGIAYMALLNWYDRATNDGNHADIDDVKSMITARVGQMAAWRRKNLEFL